ncbi:limonene-1,2-epoxide hydrolase family protein [Blastomonas sp.]|uniref:limonene-1,2-epoxide hydrolase family protein n=1 Tax=Blastomonas sp. TaxID=1909299 RepID=UPI00391A721F
MDLIATTEAFIASWNRRDAAAIERAMHPDVVCTGIPLPAAHGRAAAMAMLAPFLEAEDIDWQITAIAKSGSAVLIERTDRFRFKGSPWTTVRCAGVFRFDDAGSITTWTDYFDMAELVAAMPTGAD